MRSPTFHHRRGSGSDMTPMIDVVFLLIIFFLVSSHLSRRDRRLPLDLPVADSARPGNDSTVGLTITIDTDLKLRVEGQPTSRQQIRVLLADLVSRDGASASVRIRSDRQVRYAAVSPLLGEIARAGIAQSLIAVKPSEATVRRKHTDENLP